MVRKREYGRWIRGAEEDVLMVIFIYYRSKSRGGIGKRCGEDKDEVMGSSWGGEFVGFSFLVVFVCCFFWFG